MIELLKSVPTTVWAALLGSGFTVLGVLISNKSNNKRHRMQLEHDSAEKVKDRKATIRHGVYLLAAEELVKANNYLGSLSQVDITQANIVAPLEGFFVATSKLSMIADQETAKSVSNLVSLYSKLIFRLMEKIMPMQALKTDIQIRTEHYNQTQLEIERILSEMKRHNESGSVDMQRFSILEKSFDFQQSEAKKLSDERNALWVTFNELNIEYAKSIFQEMKEISEFQIPVLVGIRKEMELETDEEEYRMLLISQRKEIEKQLESFIKAIEGNT